nr:MAG TPA: hypothetical protein [Caudoviricetes sp.]
MLLEALFLFLHQIIKFLSMQVFIKQMIDLKIFL